MKIAITGINGRIGRAIHFSLRRNNQITGVDRSVSLITTHLGDIDDFGLLSKAFEGADAVVHTAALHAPHVGIHNDNEFYRINVKGTETVLRAARACGRTAAGFGQHSLWLATPSGQCRSGRIEDTILLGSDHCAAVFYDDHSGADRLAGYDGWTDIARLHIVEGRRFISRVCLASNESLVGGGKTVLDLF